MHKNINYSAISILNCIKFLYTCVFYTLVPIYCTTFVQVLFLLSYCVVRNYNASLYNMISKLNPVKYVSDVTLPVTVRSVCFSFGTDDQHDAPLGHDVAHVYTHA